MALSGKGPFGLVAAVAALLLAAVVALSFVDNPQPPDDSAEVAEQDHTLSADHGSPGKTAVTPVPVVAVSQPAAEKPKKTAQQETQQEQAKNLYREQNQEDREQLGSDFILMDQLWKTGRYGGNNPRTRGALEELMEKYGDTHRAKCAQYLLGKKLLSQVNQPTHEDKGRATKLLQDLVEEDPESRCETGAQAQNLARLVLATQVYRHTDWDRSVSVLEDLAQVKGEVDGLDVPLADRAKTILKEVEQMQR